MESTPSMLIHHECCFTDTWGINCWFDSIRLRLDVRVLLEKLSLPALSSGKQLKNGADQVAVAVFWKEKLHVALLCSHVRFWFWSRSVAEHWELSRHSSASWKPKARRLWSATRKGSRRSLEKLLMTRRPTCRDLMITKPSSRATWTTTSE